MRWPFQHEQEIRGLTVTQPWASLLAIGAKRIETRGWSRPYRGLVAIHSSKKFPKAERALCRREPFRQALIDGGLDGHDESLPLGMVIAVARLTSVWSTNRLLAEQNPTLLTPREHAFGDYSPDRYGFVLSDLVALKEPVPAKGALGLWFFDDQTDALAAIRTQLKAAA